MGPRRLNEKYMLLLLPEYERFDQQKIPYRHVRLSSLFESIRMGIPPEEGLRPVSREYLPAGEFEHPVLFLRMASLGDTGDKIDWTVIREDMSKRNLNLPVTEVDPDEVLQPTDYLISMRGTPRGFSLLHAGISDMPKDLQEEGLCFAASNNFMLLRPHATGMYDIPFLHLMMDVLISDLREVHENIRKGGEPPAYLAGIRGLWSRRGSSSQPGNLIGVRDLRSLVLNVPIEKEAQEMLCIRYKGLLEMERDARKKVSEFRSDFRAFLSLQ